MHTPTLLLMTSDPHTRDRMTALGAAVGFAVATAAGASEALALLRTRPSDVVLAYLAAADGDADEDDLTLIRRLRDEAPEAALVLVAGEASIDSAVQAIRLGVRHYLRPPVDDDEIRRLLGGLCDTVLRRRVHLFPAERSPGVAFHGMLGRSMPMQRLFRQLRQVAPHVRTALVTGETGTGKELVARALHRLGPRADRRFVVINCSAVVESLFESELFGHVRGAFTGASDSKAGLFELADGGTLFLDEVGELPLAVQAKLLRAIEYGEVLRVGSLEPRHVDVQIIAATNRELEDQVSHGHFRRDLFYRLNVADIHVPPLRERRDDIVYLANFFLREMATRFAKPLTGLTAGGERALQENDWPGNVRELRNVMERACLVAEGSLVGEFDVRASLPGGRRRRPASPEPLRSWGMPAPADDSETQPLSDVEREAIMRALQRAGGNKKAAASLLGVSRRALYRRLERLDLGRTIARRREGAA